MAFNCARRAGVVVALAGLAVSLSAGGAASAGLVTANWLNAASGTWNVAANWSTNPNFPNNGTPAGETYHAVIDATGAAYTVTLSSSVTLDQLTFDSADATLRQFSPAIFTLEMPSTVGAGTYRISGGTLTGIGTLSVASLMHWEAGTQSGLGRTVIEGGGTLTMDGNGTKQLSRILENDGTATWRSGFFTFVTGILQNDGSFTANAFSGTTLDAFGGSGGVGNAFFNYGTFIKIGSGVAQFRTSSTAVAFNNHGSVDIQEGTFAMRAGGTHTGDFTVAPGAFVTFSFIHAMSSEVEISGGGGMNIVDVSTSITHNGTTNLGGMTTLFGTAATFNGAATFGGLSQTGGTLTLNAPSIVDSYTSTGTLTGTGDLFVVSSMNWSAGTQSGAGRTVIHRGGMLSMSVASTKQLNRMLENDGDAIWSRGTLQFQGGILQNDGSFTAEATAGILDSFGNGGSGNAFINNGLFTKTGAGEARFRVSTTDVAFENHGLVDIQQGTLSLSGSATTMNHGQYAIHPNARLAVSGGLTGSTDSSFRFHVNGTAANSSHGQLTVSGNAILTGVLEVSPDDGFTPDWGDSWTIMTFGSSSGDFAMLDAPPLLDPNWTWWTEANATTYRVGVRHVADLNYDGAINFGDLNIILGNYNTAGSALQGDISGDGQINFTDLNIVLGLFNTTAPANGL